jgi:hypothetical protein
MIVESRDRVPYGEKVAQTVLADTIFIVLLTMSIRLASSMML